MTDNSAIKSFDEALLKVVKKKQNLPIINEGIGEEMAPITSSITTRLSRKNENDPVAKDQILQSLSFHVFQKSNGSPKRISNTFENCDICHVTLLGRKRKNS